MTRRRYSAKTITDEDYTDLVLFANSPAQAESYLYCQEQAARNIGLYVNSDKTRSMCFNKDGPISLLNDKSQKLADQFTYLGRNISSIESDVYISIGNVGTAIDR